MTHVLLHLGYPKAGSRYLREWFSANPAFRYLSDSLLGFLSIQDLSRYAQRTTELHRYFVVSSEELIVWKGDIETVGFNYVPYDIVGYQERASETLARIFPGAKVLIITRGFEATFKSTYAEALLAGYARTFDKYQDLNVDLLSTFYDFNFIIGLYRQRFGTENVIVLPYELLRDNPKAFISSIEESLELEQKFDFPTERINPSLDRKLLVTCRKLSAFVSAAVKPLPVRLQSRIYGGYTRILYQFRQHRLLRLLSTVIGNEEEWLVKSEYLERFRGRAEVLKDDPLYAPYLQEYLL